MSDQLLCDLDEKEFDYIIVGGGTSGCVVAHELILAGYTVLVVERGPSSDEQSPDPANIPGNFLKSLETDLNWQYQTIPQKGLNGRVLTGHRGTGLGGGSRLNFMSWVRGPKADFDDWGRLVGDDSWSWKKVLQDFKELETLDEFVSDDLKPYVHYAAENHGYRGPIAVGTGKETLPGAIDFIEACMEAGIPPNLDHNSGDPIGVSVAQLNCPKGIRVHSADAFLSSHFRSRHSNNLKIVTNTQCSRVLFESGRAVGVELFQLVSPMQLTRPRARKEVILTSGTIGSPHLLLLSGIGDERHLQAHSIPVIANVPGVGAGLQDHAVFSCEYYQDPSIPSYNHFLQDPHLQNTALKEYMEKFSGPLVRYGGAACVAFPVIDRLFSSPEFLALMPNTRQFLQSPTRPTTEFWLMSGPLYYDGSVLSKADSIIAHEILLQNCLSRGTVTLASADPLVPPVIDPNYLAHPYDIRMAIEALRLLLKIAQTNAYKKVLRGTLLAPWLELGDINELDADNVPEKVLEEFARENIAQGLHGVSTCRMSQAQDPMGVVDCQFQVRGVRGLRVADISVCPILTSNHTQVNAYLTGLKCARKILARGKPALQDRL